MKSFLGWTFTLALAFGVYAFDWNTFSSRNITHYSINCPVEMRGDTCPTQWVQSPRTEYAVFPEQQAVVEQSEGQPPLRLTRCAVINKKNWKCNLSSGGGVVGFTDGRYWDGYELIEGAPATRFNLSQVKAVSRWEWVLAEDARTPR